jgi:hypothetical protein
LRCRGYRAVFGLAGEKPPSIFRKTSWLPQSVRAMGIRSIDDRTAGRRRLPVVAGVHRTDTQCDDYIEILPDSLKPTLKPKAVNTDA